MLLSNYDDEQCIASFPIVLLVANRTAQTSKSIVSVNIDSIRFKSYEESTGCGGTISNGNMIYSALDVLAPGEHDAGDENVVKGPKGLGGCRKLEYQPRRTFRCARTPLTSS